MSIPVSVKPGTDGKLRIDWTPGLCSKAREVAAAVVTSSIALTPGDPDDAMHRMGVALNALVNSIEKSRPVKAEKEPEEK
ncbi:MAG: hypothetical protein HQ582_34465 [Planctomycetes bacterium]|nr:hypothetical protein [Planctomycetota bacterium]